MNAISIFLIVFGAYMLIHNEVILHRTGLKKDYQVVGWRCFFGGFMIAVGAALWIL